MIPIDTKLSSKLFQADIEKAMLNKLRNAEEKYQPRFFKKGSSEEPGTESVYWKIKKEHRQKGE